MDAGHLKEKEGVWVSVEASAFLKNSFSSIQISSFADSSSKPVLRQLIPHLNSVFMDRFHCDVCVRSSHSARSPSWEATGSALRLLLHRTALWVFEETGNFHPESALSRREISSSFHSLCRHICLIPFALVRVICLPLLLSVAPTTHVLP